MVFPIVLAAWVLAPTLSATTHDALPNGAVFHAIPPTATRSGGELAALSAASSAADPDALWGWLDQLAVVRPHRGDRRAPPSLQMFIAVSVLKGQVSLRAFGSF